MAEYVLVDGVEFVLVDGAYRPRAGVEATDCPGPFPYLVPFEGNVSAIGFIACSFLNAILFARRSRATRLLLLGAACIIVVVLTHVAEALQVFAIMGWGQSDAPDITLISRALSLAARCWLLVWSLPSSTIARTCGTNAE